MTKSEDETEIKLTRIQLPDDKLHLADRLGAALLDEAPQDVFHALGTVRRERVCQGGTGRATFSEGVSSNTKGFFFLIFREGFLK